MASSSLEYERITFVLRPRRGPRRVILDAVSGRAAAAQTTALMGPSGSGKTTLIHALAGTLRSRVPAELSGAVRVDGEPAGARRRCAVVGQEDALYPLFTVAGTRVGDPSEPLLRGVSGGERRRLSIGCELIASRGGVVLLDEPTPLDAYQALSVARSLSGLARESRVAVLLSVHQPRAEICLLLDELQLLSRGRVVYSGPFAAAEPWFAALGHAVPPRFNAMDFLLDVLAVDDGGEGRARRRLPTSLGAARDAARRAPPPSKRAPRPRARWLVQVRWLAHRTLVGFSRQTVVVVAVTSTHLLPALILVAMRSDERDGGGGLGAVRRNVDKLGTFSYMGMLLTYFGLMQVALFFAKEKPVVRSELGRYDLGAFVVAKFLGEIPITFWCPCVFLATLYWAQGTRDVGRFCAELAVVASLNWAVGAVGFVFACSDIHEADMRQITLQFATFFTLVSGVYCCLTSMPAWTRELAALSPTKWAIEALVTLEFPRPDQRYVLDTAGYERLPAARAVGILLLMAAAGRRSRCGGAVSVDGARVDTRAARAAFAALRAYVRQDCFLFPYLTVRETLHLSASLALRGAASERGARKATSRVLRELNLTSVGASLVGDGTRVRGVSGGERKRVAVGKYLFQRDLKVLLADEPTTGLDAAQALVVVATLRTLASEGGCAVYATLHQPRSSIFALLDGLHLLEGRRLRPRVAPSTTSGRTSARRAASATRRRTSSSTR
ncbi:ATPase [Aureococcus anophagefferens]|nr:ATPase [Aureococcus anophagefferens]